MPPWQGARPVPATICKKDTRYKTFYKHFYHLPDEFVCTEMLVHLSPQPIQNSKRFMKMFEVTNVAGINSKRGVRVFVPDFSRMMQLLNGAQYWLLHNLNAVIQCSY